MALVLVWVFVQHLQVRMGIIARSFAMALAFIGRSVSFETGITT